LDIHQVARLLRSRWITICASVAVAGAVAAVISVLTTPLYQASTRLFVSTTTRGSESEVYGRALASQQRVFSYADLITGEALAQRTIDKVHLDMSAESLRQKVNATVPADTVMIDVSVLDPSPVQARDLANAVSDELVDMVRELETPPDGGRPDARVVVERRASLPADPVIPQTPRNIALGIALGLLIGIGLAVLRDRLDTTATAR
jgi:capsular polysaccharide biosynthesis protein